MLTIDPTMTDTPPDRHDDWVASILGAVRVRDLPEEPLMIVNDDFR